jgi:lysophospholipase
MAEPAESHAPDFTPTRAIFAPRMIATKSGTRLRTATFPAAPNKDRGRICVLLNGQTEFIEKYFEVIDELRSRGFGVATLDWRGQGGSARTLSDTLKVHISDFSEYDEDLETLLHEIVAPLAKRPPVGLAHSMGGHNLLRTLHARTDAFACAVLCAPMIAISMRGFPSLFVRAVTSAMVLRGAADSWALGMGQDPLKRAFADQMVTSDPVRFRRTVQLLAQNPDIRLAGPTWGWLQAALVSMRRMRAHRYAAAITTPTLIIGAGHDRICISHAAKVFASHMPNGKYVEVADAEHEILMEQDRFRAQFWKEFDAFVSAHI